MWVREGRKERKTERRKEGSDYGDESWKNKECVAMEWAGKLLVAQSSFRTPSACSGHFRASNHKATQELRCTSLQRRVAHGSESPSKCLILPDGSSTSHHRTVRPRVTGQSHRRGSVGHHSRQVQQLERDGPVEPGRTGLRRHRVEILQCNTSICQ